MCVCVPQHPIFMSPVLELQVCTPLPPPSILAGILEPELRFSHCLSKGGSAVSAHTQTCSPHTLCRWFRENMNGTETFQRGPTKLWLSEQHTPKSYLSLSTHANQWSPRGSQSEASFFFFSPHIRINRSLHWNEHMEIIAVMSSLNSRHSNGILSPLYFLVL